MNILQVTKQYHLIKKEKEEEEEQAKFTDCPLRKAFEKQTKTIKDPGEKQIKAKLLDKSTEGAIETASKRAIQKNAGATGDLIGKKIADKITNSSKKSSKQLRPEKEEVNSEIPKERNIFTKKRQQIIDELRLV